jgi:transcriptional regulator with XRE-family HTH domain
MTEPDGAFTSIDDRVGVNLRAYRDAAGLSQEELAQRMAERGFGFSQATVWKIESGNRPIKISEAVALADALDLRAWDSLTQDPTRAWHQIQLGHWHRAAAAAYEQLKTAATAYIDTQLNLTVVIRDAQDAGLTVSDLWSSWLNTPAERAVIEARIEDDNREAAAVRIDEEVDRVLQALRDHGHEAILDPAEIEADEDPEPRPSGEGAAAADGRLAQQEVD